MDGSARANGLDAAARSWLLSRFVPFAAPLVLTLIAYFVTLGPVLRADGGQQDLYTAVKLSVDAARARAASVDVLFLGNSRVVRGVDPTYLEFPAHNFAFDDDTLLYYGPKSRFLRRLRDERGAGPWKTVFVGVDVFQLGYWNYDRYFAYRELLADAELDGWLFDPRYGPTLLGSLFEKKVALRNFYRTALVSLLKERLTGARNPTNQFGETYTLEPTGYYRVTYATRRHFNPDLQPRGPIDPRNVALLEETVAELADRGTDVVLFTPPTSTEYRKPTLPEDRARFDEIVHAIAARHHATYVSWETDAAFSDDDYPDGTHLSVDAAARFSRIVSDWLASRRR